MTVAKVALAGVGIVAIALAMMGFWYNWTTLDTDFSPIVQKAGTPYFYHAFYVLTVICLACYFALLYIGIEFCRGRTTALPLFVFLLLFELVFFLAVGFLCAA